MSRSSYRIILNMLLGLALVGVACPVFSQAQTSTLNVRDAGAVGDGTTNDTAAFQTALDTVKTNGGGVVFVPAGNYMISTHLTIPEDVTLEGTFRAPVSIDSNFSQLTQPNTFQGSVLLAIEGQGNANGTPFITMSNNSTIKGIVIYHPQQSATSPVAYPWAIRGSGDSNSVVDVELVNPWQGVDFGTNIVARHYIKGLYGQPISIGIYVDQCADVGRIEDVHFWPFWTPDSGSPVRAYTRANGIAFKFGRTDWQMAKGCFCLGYNVGYKFVRGVMWRSPDRLNQVPNVMLASCGQDECTTGVLVEDCLSFGGLYFANCQFRDKLTVSSTNTGPVKLVSCGFAGASDTTSNVEAWGTGTVSLNKCHFDSWDVQSLGAAAIYANCDRLSVSGCDFVLNTKNQIKLDTNFKSAVVTGNFLRGGRRITALGTGHLLESANATD
ncbi:MAG: glycosyl hydrolase family 28-related protein [Armatimonadota bacterium]